MRRGCGINEEIKFDTSVIVKATGLAKDEIKEL